MWLWIARRKTFLKTFVSITSKYSASVFYIAEGQGCDGREDYCMYIHVPGIRHCISLKALTIATVEFIYPGTERIEWSIEDQAVSWSYDLVFRQSLPLPLPAKQRKTRLTRETTCWGEGVARKCARSQIIQRKKAVFSINHSTLSALALHFIHGRLKSNKLLYLFQGVKKEPDLGSRIRIRNTAILSAFTSPPCCDISARTGLRGRVVYSRVISVVFAAKYSLSGTGR